MLGLLIAASAGLAVFEANRETKALVRLSAATTETERQQNADLRHALAAVENQVAALKAQNDALRHSIEILGKQVVATR